MSTVSAVATALPKEAKLLPRKPRSLVRESEEHCFLHFLSTCILPGPTLKLSKRKAKAAGSLHPTSDLPLLPNSRSVLDYSELGSAPTKATGGSWPPMTLLGHLPVGL